MTTVESSEGKPLDVLDYLLELTKSSREASLAYKVERVRLMLSDSLKSIRAKKSISQKDLAERMGVTQGWVSKLESPNNDHTFESIAQYLFALGADLKLSASMGGAESEIVDSKCDPSFGIASAVLPEFLSLVEEKINNPVPANNPWSHPLTEPEIPFGSVPSKAQMKNWWDHAA